MHRSKSLHCVLALLFFTLFFGARGAEPPDEERKEFIAVIMRDMSPSCFLDTETGKPDGFGVELLEILAKQAGIAISYQAVGDWEEVEEALKSGQADLCPVIAVTEQRQEYLNFTDVTETHGITINVRSDNRDIKGLADLKGRNVSVIRASQAHDLLKDDPDIRLHLDDSFQVGLLDLLSGHVDAFVTPTYIILNLAQDAGLEDSIRVLSPPLKEFKRAIGVRKENEALCALLEEELAEFKSTSDYQTLFVKWFGRPQPYWTADRVGKLAGASLVAIVICMFLWRHFSIVRLHRKLMQSEERYRLAMEAATDGVWDWNVSEGRVEYNPAWRKILDLGDAGNKIETWTARIHPDEKEAVLESLQPCLKGLSEYWSREHRLQTANGEWKWVLGRGRVVLRDAHKRPLRMIGTMTDVSERKRAEIALRESREMLNRVLDTVPQSIFWKDREGRYLGCNRVFAEAVGLSEPTQIVGKTDFDLPWPREEAEAYRADDREVMETGRSKRHIIEPLQQADGVRLWIDTSKVPLFDENARPVGVLGAYEDITERKRVEEEREQLRDQLTQAQKMESVGRLAGGVAHDFNNMLQAILGNVELALDEYGPESPAPESLLEIQKCAQRSADLTRQLLAFARRQVIAPKVLDLNQTIESMLKMLKRLIGEDIDLLWKPAPHLESVLIDPAQIDQTLANLCVNARDAIGHQNGKVTIETGMADFDEEYCAAHTGFIPGRYVRLSVSDDGCGMDEKIRKNIFEPFFTTKCIGEGTGLGLATVYGVVKQNEGFINVYSEPGHGTTFHIYFPCGPAPTDRACEPMETTTPRGDETILLVEDEPAILRMTVMMLERQGYTVLAASTPGQALELSEQLSGQIDLLITDVIMPEMNGRDLARNLMIASPRLKSLFMSGYTSDVIAHHGMLDPGIHFISKPFSAKDLAAKVREVLDKG